LDKGRPEPDLQSEREIPRNFAIRIMAIKWEEFREEVSGLTAERGKKRKGT
jgi:hypothetical protein